MQWDHTSFNAISANPSHLLSLTSGEKISFPGWSTDLHIKPSMRISNQQHFSRWIWSVRLNSTKPEERRKKGLFTLGNHPHSAFMELWAANPNVSQIAQLESALITTLTHPYSHILLVVRPDPPVKLELDYMSVQTNNSIHYCSMGSLWDVFVFERKAALFLCEITLNWS